MAIYLDHNATSPLHAEVVDAMLPFLRQGAANPSSLHGFGRMARSAIESARTELAQLLNCDSDAIIFTSGGTEANNLALKGFSSAEIEGAVVSTAIEHASVLEPLKDLERAGIETVLLAVDSSGRVDLEQARRLLDESQPQLLSVQAANNETGAIQPLRELIGMVDRHRCFVHSDAVQAVGKLPVDFAGLGVDALSLSAHKLAGPQGVGALISDKRPSHRLISGGDQEKKRRGGTENVAGIVGFGQAARLARLELEHRQHHLSGLRDAFESRLAGIAGCQVFAATAPRLANTTFFALPFYHGETLLMELDRAGFAVASGSACHSAVTEPSHVLKAMGIDDNLALNAIRVSFGMDNNLAQVLQLVDGLEKLVDRLPAVMRRVAV